MHHAPAAQVVHPHRGSRTHVTAAAWLELNLQLTLKKRPDCYLAAFAFHFELLRVIGIVIHRRLQLPRSGGGEELLYVYG